MTNPIPFKVEVSGNLEEAPSGAIPASLYGDVGGGSGGDGNAWIPRVTDSSTTITAHYGVDNIEEPDWSVASSVITLDRDRVSALIRDVSSGSYEYADTTLHNGANLIRAGIQGQEEVNMELRSDGSFFVSSGEFQPYSGTDRANVLRLSLGRVEGDLELRATHYKTRLGLEPEPQGPYLAEVDDGVITLAALRKYVEDTIGYGEPGQVLATNSTGDGYEWVTAPAGT